ncbi:MAG: hypothetical protein IT581_14335 [Verrucomicrobiales bacterium]|nr:hypothetical protein [Verrucomicrobiales bacterium]
MAQLIVRDLEERLVRKLKERAGRHGVSMEEEHRRILREVLLQRSGRKTSFHEVLLAIPNVGTDHDFARSSEGPRKVDLG